MIIILILHFGDSKTTATFNGFIDGGVAFRNVYCSEIPNHKLKHNFY
ncbi:MAG: hypothetical protein JWR54_1242 [Mucilaginibacter sp.]|jgi:hypothetical protein|nr:hypothetical protein [Mucilaginibacter sp.]